MTAAFINALREEGTKEDCLIQLERIWDDLCQARGQRLEKGVPPLLVVFLIECRSSANPGINIWPGGWDSPAGQETRDWLKKQGLVFADYSLTARGSAWLEKILQTPLPEQVR